MRFRTGYNRNTKIPPGNGFRGYVVETDSEFQGPLWQIVRRQMIEHVRGNPERFGWYEEGMDPEELNEWAETIICRMSRCIKSHCDGTESDADDHVEVTLGDAARFLEKLAPFIKAGFDLVDQEVAEERAAECAQCEKNRPGRWKCFWCQKLVNFVMEKLKGRTTRLDHRLQQCTACKCFNRASIWCPDDVLRATSPEGARYADCWKDKVINPDDQESGVARSEF